jgi:MFS family permease
VYRNAPYLRYLVGQALSTLGDQVWYVALSWSAVRHAGAATAGFVLSVSAIPRLLFLMFGGVVADRFDVRRLMLGSDALRTVVCLAAAAIALADPGIGLLVGIALVFGTVDA